MDNRMPLIIGDIVHNKPSGKAHGAFYRLTSIAQVNGRYRKWNAVRVANSNFAPINGLATRRLWEDQSTLITQEWLRETLERITIDIHTLLDKVEQAGIA